MSNYEQAPATKILNTHCAACGRPLLDAESVTSGMGPTCRARYGHTALLSEDDRRTANKLVHLCARADVTPEELSGAIVALALLGCQRLADRMSKRAGRVVVVTDGDHVDVKCPYKQEFLDNRGTGRWVASQGVTRFHARAAVTLARAVSAAYPTFVVRFHESPDADPEFITQEELSARMLELAASAPVPAGPEALPTPKISGHPSRLRDRRTWGVCLERGTYARPGQLVLVKPRGDAEPFMKRLVRLDNRAKWGDVWAAEPV